MSGDTLTIVMFFFGSAVACFTAAVSAWKHGFKWLTALTVIFVILGASWYWIGNWSPVVTALVAETAKSPVSWFVLVVLCLCASLVLRAHALQTAPQQATDIESAAKQTKFDPTKYDVKIRTPKNGDLVGKTFDMSGTYATELPPDHVIAVCELQPNRAYRPRKIAIPADRNEWNAFKLYSGEEPGEEKILVVGIIGPPGKVIFDYFAKVGHTYEYKGRPAVDDLDKVFYRCDQVRVRIRS
jgi:hypothetical protein